MKPASLLQRLLWLLRRGHGLRGSIYLACFLLSTLLMSNAYADEILLPIQISQHTPYDHDVYKFILSANDQYVVYNTYSNETLWRVRTDGGADAEQLTPPFSPQQKLATYKLSPDSNYVVYERTENTYKIQEIYSVPISGGVPLKLNAPSVISGSIYSDFEISPDSSRVVYLAEQDNVYELYSASINGEGVVKLNGELTEGGDVRTYWNITADGAYVVYIADQDTDEVQDLYSVPITGGTVVKLNSQLAIIDDVFPSFALSSDSQYVVYRAYQPGYMQREIFSVPIGGGKATKLNPPLPANGSVTNFRVTNDGKYVIYTANQETDDFEDFYRVPITGGQAVQLTALLENRISVFEFEISPDDAYVVYQGGSLGEGLYSISIADGAVMQLYEPLSPSSWIEIGRFVISPDSSHVLYGTGRSDYWNPSIRLDPQQQIYSVPIVGGKAVKLNQPLDYSYSVGRRQISLDSKYVVYTLEHGDFPFFTSEYYVTPLEGGPRTRLYGSFRIDALGGFYISADGGFVTYKADRTDHPTDNSVYKVFVARDAPCLIGFTAASQAAVEEEGVITLTVALNHMTTFSTVKVAYQVVGGTATGNGVDYLLPENTLIFKPGMISSTIPITLRTDDIVESDETVIISLREPQNAMLGSQTTITLTIQDGLLPLVNTYLPVVWR